MWGDDSEIMSIALFFPDHHLPHTLFWLADYHQYHLVKVRWTKLMGWMGADYKYRRGPVCQLSERWFWWLSPGGWSPPRGFCYVVVCQTLSQLFPLHFYNFAERSYFHHHWSSKERKSQTVPLCGATSPILGHFWVTTVSGGSGGDQWWP